MAGVYAYPHAALVVDFVYYVGQMLKCESEIAPLARSVLYHGFHPFGLLQSKVYRLCYQVKTCLLLHLVQMASGMKIHHRKPKGMGAVQFIYKCLAALGKFFGVRCPEIYQKAVVRQYVFRRIAVLRTVCLELFYLSRLQRCRFPSLGLTGE
ncbi:unknown [Bacteroides sp. CAG:927]|nr:unknown [Bacteroides sp. CAG:927]